MVISKFAFRIAALAAIIGAPIWQPVRAEEAATEHTSDSASCPRSTFRVVIDVGHTATSPGADSARGVPEYEFNRDGRRRSLTRDEARRIAANIAKLPELQRHG